MSESTPTSPDWLTLSEDEWVVLRTTPSRNLVLAALAAGFGLLLVMSVAVSTMDDVGTARAISLAVLVVIVGLLVAAFFFIRLHDYIVTNQRVCVGVGLRSKRCSSMPLTEVRDVNLHQSAWQQLVSIGTLRFVADSDHLSFSLVDRPLRVQQEVLQAVETGS